jgi:hypothetical protein
MDGTGRERARWLGARRAVVVPVIAGMLTSCSNADEPQQRSGPTAREHREPHPDADDRTLPVA